LHVDHSFVEITEHQRNALGNIANLFNKFVDLSAHGVKSFKDQAHISEFAK